MAFFLVNRKHLGIIPIVVDGHVGIGIFEREVGSFVVGVLHHFGVAFAVGRHVVSSVIVGVSYAVYTLLTLNGYETNLLVGVAAIESILQRTPLFVAPAIKGCVYGIFVFLVV